MKELIVAGTLDLDMHGDLRDFCQRRGIGLVERYVKTDSFISLQNDEIGLIIDTGIPENLIGDKCALRLASHSLFKCTPPEHRMRDVPLEVRGLGGESIIASRNSLLLTSCEDIHGNIDKDAINFPLSLIPQSPVF